MKWTLNLPLPGPNEAPEEVRPVVNNPYDDHDGLTS